MKKKREDPFCELKAEFSPSLGMVLLLFCRQFLPGLRCELEEVRSGRLAERRRKASGQADVRKEMKREDPGWE